MQTITLRRTEIIFPEKGKIKSKDVFGSSRVFIVCDTHTKKHCLPAFAGLFPGLEYSIYCIPEGESSKNLKESDKLIRFYIEQQVNRNDIIVALGGGVVCDITGFTASIYKRGIRCILIPTTLLAMVDAAIGGKNGIDYRGVKNLLGNFYDPEKVIVIPTFLETLDNRHIVAGKAEVLKTLLLGTDSDAEKIIDSGKINPDAEMIYKCIRIKAGFVEKDYFDKGIRNALNLGHTLGHAIESYSISRHPNPLIHGEAVAAGLLCELYISCKKAGLKVELLEKTTAFIVSNFNSVLNDCMKYDNLENFLKHDKKNTSPGSPSFTLLEAPGIPVIKQKCGTALIKESLKFYINSYTKYTKKAE